LRKSFQAHFLTSIRELWKNQLLEKAPLSKRFMFAPLYQNKVIQEVLGKVWFVWIGKKLDNAFNAVTYVARYTKRPPVAESGKRTHGQDMCLPKRKARGYDQG
jgi:Putative transposase